jgi:ammonium transporter, Amt family
MKSYTRRVFFTLLLLLSVYTVMDASDGNGIDTGVTAWMLTSTALVLLMIPGLAMFYGGLVRSKNVLGTIMHSFVAMGVMSVLWVFVSYSMCFGPNILGGLDRLEPRLCHAEGN